MIDKVAADQDWLDRLLSLRAYRYLPLRLSAALAVSENPWLALSFWQPGCGTVEVECTEFCVSDRFTLACIIHKLQLTLQQFVGRSSRVTGGSVVISVVQLFPKQEIATSSACSVRLGRTRKDLNEKLVNYSGKAPTIQLFFEAPVNFILKQMTLP